MLSITIVILNYGSPLEDLPIPQDHLFILKFPVVKKIIELK